METWKKNLYSLWIAQFLALSGMSFIIPFIPFYIQQLGVTGQKQVIMWSGILFAGPLLISSFMTPVWGMLGDRYGRKIMVVRAVFGITVVTALMSLAANVHQLLILRLLQGGITGFGAACVALVAVGTPRQHTSYALGTLYTSVLAGGVVGPLLGGFLADLIGYRHVFWVTACLSVISGIIVIIVVKEEHKPWDNEKNHSVLSNCRLVINSLVLRTTFLVMLLVQFAMQIVEPFLPLYVQSMGVKPAYLSSTTGLIFAVTGIASIFSVPNWGKRLDEHKDYVGTLGFMLLGSGIIYAVQAIAYKPYQLLLMRIALGIFVAAITPTVFTIISAIVPHERKAGTLSIMQSAALLGTVVGPMTGATIAAWAGMRSVFYITGALLVLAAGGTKLALKNGDTSHFHK
jgi:DHA1 family multidrug resistance protein-like MFS transporter